jgi:hypothetical protein
MAFAISFVVTFLDICKVGQAGSDQLVKKGAKNTSSKKGIMPEQY